MDPNQMTKMLAGLKMLLPKYAPAEITKIHGVMWSNALKEFSEKQIKKSFDYASVNLTSFPAPATIKELCLGQTKESEEVGQETCALILKSISKWGAWHPKEAKKEIGQLGWEVVEACGGWSEVCDITYEHLPSCKKQWRELAASFHKGFIRDGHNKPHSINGKSLVPDFLLE